MVATGQEQRRFGLVTSCINDIQNVLSRSPHIEKAVLFGSRAMGTYKNGSDIDLALFGDALTHADVITLYGQLDELPYAYTFDLIDYNKISNSAVKAHIDDLGITFYEKEKTSLPLGWNEFTLGEIANIQTGPFGSQLHASDYVDVGIPVIMPTNIGENIIIEKSIARTSTFKASSLKRHFVSEGDIIYSRRGDVERKAYISAQESGWICGTGCLKVRITNPEVNSKYISYALGTESVRNYIRTNAVGSTMPNLNTGILSNIQILIPPLETQTEIASILSAFDDKIELNRQMNQTLETIAQTLFTDWFVKFNFPGFDGELVDGLPKGWRRLKLTELLNTISHTHKFPSDKIIFLNTSDIYNGSVIADHYSDVKTLPGQAKKSIRKGDILLSEIRPANRRFAFVDFDAQEYVVSTKLMVLRSKGTLEGLSIYYFIKMGSVLDELQMLAELRSGTFPQITYSELSKIEMVVADDTTNALFFKFIQSIHNKIRLNETEIQTLIQLRDRLLPKLMSGQIPVGANV